MKRIKHSLKRKRRRSLRRIGGKLKIRRKTRTLKDIQKEFPKYGQ